MKITVDRTLFASTATDSVKALSPNPDQPILRGLLLEAEGEGEKLTISGYDHETSTRATISAEVAEPGRTLISGRMLASVVAKLPKKPITLTTTGDSCDLECGTARFHLPVMDSDAYPQLPTSSTVAGTVEAGALSAAVARVAVAAGRDASRGVAKSGLHVQADGGELVLTATDSFRAARCRIPWTPAGDEMDAVLVPASTMTSVVGLLGEEEVSLHPAGIEGGGVLGLEADGHQLTTRLIAERFPDMTRHFALPATTTVTVERAELAEVVARVATVAETKGGTPPVVRLEMASGQVDVSMSDASSAYGSDVVGADIEGDDVVCWCKAEYLTAALGSFAAPAVAIGYTTSPTALTIVGLDGDGEPDESHKHMLALMRDPALVAEAKK